jgi:hypothetical protein
MKYRKKPIVIEAMQLTEENYLEVYEWVNNLWTGNKTVTGIVLKEKKEHNGLPIKTLEGTMVASIGDYIIKGVKGEFYPCKPDIFEETYERVQE